MSYGIITKGLSGEVTFNSADRSGMYFSHQFTATNSINSGLPSGFSQAFSICSPTTTPYYSHMAPGDVFITPNSALRYAANIGTSDSLNAAAYVEPYRYAVGGVNTLTFTIIPQPAEVSVFGKRPPYSSDFGMKTVAADGNTIIHENYRGLVAQTDVVGNYTFSGTAYSLNTDVHAVQPVLLMYNPFISKTKTITFPKPLLKPPLIMITESSGPIALYSFTKDGSGKYDGAVIICPADNISASLYSTQGNWTGFIYRGERGPVTFSYYLLSEEDPLFVDSSIHGMIVRNQTGGAVFDSRWIAPSVVSYAKVKPYRYYTADGSGGWYASDVIINNSRSVGNPDPIINASSGICLNNLLSFYMMEEITQFNYKSAGGTGPAPGVAGIRTSLMNAIGMYLTVNTTLGLVIRRECTVAALGQHNIPAGVYSTIFEVFEFNSSPSIDILVGIIE